MAQACPNCGGFDISQELDRYHCLNCGNYFTYDNETAKDGPAPEALFTPDERTVEAEPMREPTDHAAIAAESQTGNEGIDTGEPVLDQEPTAGQTSAEKAPSPTPEAAPASEVPSGETVSEPAQEPA